MNYVDCTHCKETNSLYYMAECAYFLCQMALRFSLIVRALSLCVSRKLNIYDIYDIND
jgi:hypothetical protein